MSVKKAYIKPAVTFDCFELNDSIAAGCAFINSNHAPYVCPVYDVELGYSLFSQMYVCDSTPSGGNDSICYNVPLSDWSVYTS